MGKAPWVTRDTRCTPSPKATPLSPPLNTPPAAPWPLMLPSPPTANCTVRRAARRPGRRTGSRWRCAQPFRRSVRPRRAYRNRHGPARCAPRKPGPPPAAPRRENTRYWSGGSSHSITASAGSSKYSTLLAAMPTPTVPAQSVTSGSSALRWSRISCASRRVMVGDVEQRQRGCAGVAGQRHLGAQLRQHQRRRHAPLRVGGVGVGKELHDMPRLPWRRQRVARRADLRGALAGFWSPLFRRLWPPPCGAAPADAAPEVRLRVAERAARRPCRWRC